MRPVARSFLVLVVLSLAASCRTLGDAHDTAHASIRPVATACDAVSGSTSVPNALVSVRECLKAIDAGTALVTTDAETYLRQLLDEAASPRVRQASAEIVARFFDGSRLRLIPSNEQELEAYLGLLEDQRIRAQAVGDTAFVAAIRKRQGRIVRLRELMVDSSLDPTHF